MKRMCKIRATVSGGFFAVLAGCDPRARDMVLGGTQDAALSLMTALVQACFETLDAQAADVVTVRTVADSVAQLHS